MITVSVTALAHLYDLQCPRHLVWLTDGQPRPRIRWEETPAGEVLARLGQEHEKHVVQRLVPPGQLATPEYPPGDFDRGAAATCALIEAESPWIEQAVLLGPMSPELGVRGMADLLRRCDDGRYQVIEIKSSRRLKTSQVLQAAVYTELLQRITPVADPLMIDGHYGSHEPPRLASEAILGELVTDLIPRWLRAGDDVFHRTMRCGRCPFDPVCAADARQRRHVSLVPGLTPAVATRLKAAGVGDLPGLVAMDTANLHALAVDGHLLQRLQGQARSIVEERILPTGEVQAPPGTVVQLFLDAAPDPTAAVPCRLGLLKRDRSKGLSAYRGVAIPSDHGDAAKKVRAFLELAAHQATKAVRDGLSWGFLYFGPSTVEALADLVAWMGWGDELLEQILVHAMDVQALIRRRWYLPVERYDLARVLAASGLDPMSDESPPFIHHVAWRAFGDEAAAQSLLAQGEETLRSVMALWDWLEADARSK
ncbi:TM0106 family RecB-like putative nuclease [Candidatus Fermentibacteria bacterium]|nr:TM0106 family RecB-like putative nuclease [Candidatus Fermentibacteria bacterium]